MKKTKTKQYPCHQGRAVQFRIEPELEEKLNKFISSKNSQLGFQMQRGLGPTCKMIINNYLNLIGMQ